MKKLALTILLVATLTLVQTGTAFAAALPRVTGAGAIVFTAPGYEGGSSRFNFSARQVDPVTEMAEGKIRLTEEVGGERLTIIGEVLYVSVDGDNAWIGFVTTLYGQEIDYVIQVQDGQTDKISIPFPMDASDATSHPDFTQAGELPEAMLSVVHGNIQIK